MSRVRSNLVLVPAALAFALIASAGCSGNEGTKSTATSPSQRPNAADQLLQYTRCMRAHGVNMPDPNNEDAPLPKPEGNPSVRAAYEQCRGHLPTKMQGNGGDPRQHDSLVALARCLRRQGVNVPDPQPGQNLALPPGSGHDQRVQDAIAACGKPGNGKSGTGQGSE